MLGSWQLNEFSTSEQFFVFSDAYLDSAERLCKVLVRSTRKANYQRGAVVIYLTFHAIELFLKGAILKKSPNEKLNHKISEYENRYNKLYPKKFFRLNIPFRMEYVGFEPPEIKALKKTEPPTDQLYRYPTNNSGQPWDALLAFEPKEFLKTIEGLKKDFSRINKEMNPG